ncbi:NAD(P)-dependent alcohol dehydrogenase [Oerskovia flava]|uniref:NAD(P)-dependent alcohol dehydrogenase n=1 Tax=Oerskovia flava TaxID=2986422 RepID=UPI002240652E|nr:NAD(P)-dependent alcohol dehydrogenase [Oerskovia sp. JB1-3-2]
MRAIVQHAYGTPDVLQLTELDVPAVADDEVLVRVHAASLNAADTYLTSGTPYVVRLASGPRRPRTAVPGRDLAGVVEAVGTKVTDLRPGDAVYGETTTGTLAEYAHVPARHLLPKPAGLTFTEAAAVPLAANTAFQGLSGLADVQPGQRVLVNGASGGVGTFAVQVAVALGAHVTGVCSTANVDLVRSLGAEDVVDYSQEDFTSDREPYDVVLDLVGNRSLGDCRRALTGRGLLVLSSGAGGRVLGPAGRMLRALVWSPFVGQRLRPLTVAVGADRLRPVSELVDAGSLAPVVSRTYPLAETADALRHVAGGHARGKVVIEI